MAHFEKCAHVNERARVSKCSCVSKCARVSECACVSECARDGRGVREMRSVFVAGALCVLLLASCLVFAGCSCSTQAANETDAQSRQEQESASDYTARMAAEADQAYEDAQNAEASEEALVARDEAVSILDAVAAGDSSVVEPYLAKTLYDPIDFGLTYEEFCECFFDGFSYEVTGLHDVADGSVEVVVSLMTHDGRTATNALGDVYQEAYAAGNTAVMTTYADEVMANLAFVELEFSLYMVQDESGSWMVENAADFGGALLGGYDMRQEGDE
jgi:hypothetical protein